MIAGTPEIPQAFFRLDNTDSSPALEILPTHTAALFQAAVKRAAELLRAGEPVALPTETVYGLAANALEARAVARIFQIKGRPAHNPIIVQVSSLDMAKRCVAEWPALAESLARSFWPGPLTLVLPRSREIPDIVIAGGATVGVRWPSHPFIQAVIRECGFPLAAPSANLSGGVSPTNAEHVRRGLGDKIRLIVDGGQAQVGIESTVVDISTTPARVLRPGMIHTESLLAALPETGRLRIAADAGEHTDEIPRSPGRLPKHYSPKARLEILSWRDEADLHSQIAKRPSPMVGVHVIAHTVIPSGGAFGRVSVIPHDAEAFARAIYGELHQCDEAGAELIVVESPPETSEWEGIIDRLKRASA
ncbi:MAG TPA: L-threonylcarbamoyladenylate synthase [Verrucomicrobiae bacterium]|nr:L-threonylcarbamoyladenylate synthase [Verrucomicrobiae bacterium]